MPPEPKFTPKPGQIDFTNIRRAPVINCLVKYKDNILLLKRSKKMRLYPGYWSGVSGFLDDDRGVEAKVREELKEELGISKEDILSIKQGEVFEREEEKYQKTWIVHPILVSLKTDKVKLDWEAEKCIWVFPKEIKNFDVIPGFERILESFDLLV